MRYILDADSVIDHLSTAYNLLARIPDLRPHDLALVATTLIELDTGIEGSRAPRRAERDLRNFLRFVTDIPLIRRVIRATARLRHDLVNRRLPIKHRAYDLITAAAALEYGLTIVSSNTSDYQDIAGLQQFDPRTQKVLSH